MGLRNPEHDRPILARWKSEFNQNFGKNALRAIRGLASRFQWTPKYDQTHISGIKISISLNKTAAVDRSDLPDWSSAMTLEVTAWRIGSQSRSGGEPAREQRAFGPLVEARRSRRRVSWTDGSWARLCCSRASSVRWYSCSPTSTSRRM